MKRIYADLHLRPPSDQIDEAKRLIKRASELGYSIIGLSLPLNGNREIIEALRKEFPDVDLVTRIDLSPKNARDLLKLLGKVRWKFEIVSVECMTRDIALQAAKDRRVDLLFFAPEDSRKHFFGISEAKLASEKNAALEINMSPILYLSGPSRINLLRVLRREVLIAMKYGVPIIISSGASNPYMLRRPEDYAFLVHLIDLDLNSAKEALSKNPKAIVERNRRKLSENYVCPGVHIIRRGEDCQ
ncbi:MAG: RNase P subunit p30 family protein [Candidatus Bathyarchaeia archaeon]